MTRTEAILSALTTELERNRAALDNNALLETVTLAVRLDPRRGVVRKVEFGQGSMREV